MSPGRITFATPTMFWTAIVLASCAVVIAILRRPAIPKITAVLSAGGLALLCLAAGTLRWSAPVRRSVTVMVDLSPSTRSADYRDGAKLDRRIRQLLDNAPFRITFFADGVRTDVPDGPILPDLPADRTVYDPPDAAPVLLFSDGRFDAIPASGPPTYPVLDPGLLASSDAAVEELTLRSGTATVKLRNSGPPRELSLSGTVEPKAQAVPPGLRLLSAALESRATEVAARLSAGDLWPENDALAGTIPPPARFERWIVGGSSPDANWRSFSPSELPTETGPYLTPAVIVLDNVSATALSHAQLDRLQQYVRDLGGSLILLGGDHAFAAGGYPGTILEALSPLASTPPQPVTRWLLLADASGSMNASAGAATRWQFAADAMLEVLPKLPPDDRVSIGSFAEKLTWWSSDRSVRDTQAIALPPGSIAPSGPTNLRPALDQIVSSADAAMPQQLLVLSDADTDIGDADVLATAMRAKKIHLSLLALGEGQGLPALQRVVGATGGKWLRQDDSGKWLEAAEKLARQGFPGYVERKSLSVHFINALQDIGEREVSPWNRTWLKREATPLATGKSDESIVGGRWNLGDGTVAAFGFTTAFEWLPNIAAPLARRPRDPRYRVTWATGATLQVTLDAGDDRAYLNGLKPTLELSSNAGGAMQQLPIPQDAPGEYRISLPAPRSSSIAKVRLAGQVIDQIAVAGRYAPEFDSIGVDREVLTQIATRTGGAVIDPLTTSPIQMHWPKREIELTAWLTSLGATLIAAGLIWWRMR